MPEEFSSAFVVTSGATRTRLAWRLPVPGNCARPGSRVRGKDMNGDVEMRPAQTADLDEIVNVHVRSWIATYRGVVPDSFLDELDAVALQEFWAQRIHLMALGRHFVVVASAEDMIVGFAYGCETPDDDLDSSQVGLINFFHVDPAFWGRGVGRRLMGGILEWMASAQFSKAVLWVVEGNSRARAFYEALGWEWDGSSRADQLAVGAEEGAHVNALRYTITWPRRAR